MPDTEPLRGYVPTSDEAIAERAMAFYDSFRLRRSVRAFSERPVPRAALEACLLAAGSAPSGANQQPWHFAVVTDPTVKRTIREAAEREERAFYDDRAPEAWLQALRPLGTDADKPFLETAPVLIAIFAQPYRVTSAGEKVMHYYATESVGIATGVLITALHQAGLVCLTHTPSPMGFLNEILERPAWERPFLLLVVGHPAPDARVPSLARKALGEIASFRYEGPARR